MGTLTTSAPPQPKKALPPATGNNGVLLVTIRFPPEGGGGSIRVTKMAKYLAAFGWNTVVLTTRPSRKTEIVEPPMEGVPVFRAPRLDVAAWTWEAVRSVGRLITLLTPSAAFPGGTEAAGVTRPRRRYVDYVLLPDGYVFWVPLAVLFGLSAIRRHRPKIIYSTSPTATAHLAAYWLHLLTGLPWVVEFRDPWMLNPFRQARPWLWMERLENWMEDRVLHTATRLVVTSQEYKSDLLQKYPDLPENHVIYLPNGFDPQDFENAVSLHFDKFTIVHAGNFYEQRTARPFLVALRRWFDEEPEARTRTQILFVGREGADSSRAIAQFGLEDVVAQVVAVSHRRAVQYMLSADLLLLVPGPGTGTMPGKTFEYLASRKPVLVVADEGPARRLVSSARIGSVVSTTDEKGMVSELSRLRRVIAAGAFPYPDTSDLLNLYDRRRIAGLMANVFSELVTAQ